MTDQPDAFKERMAAARLEHGRQELAHQSLGRPLTDQEHAFADALMAIYADGTTDQTDVARALTDRGIVAPLSGHTAWTAEGLEAELQRLNSDLDTAFEKNGSGAGAPSRQQ